MSNYSKGNLEARASNTSWAKIFNYVAQGSLVLDVGCSSGNLGKELKKQKNCQVYGIEIDKSDVLAARKVLDGVFSVNIENQSLPLELKKHKFDAIILADVIEHFVDPSAALIKLKSLLKTDGRLIFSIPNMAHISVRLQVLGGHFNYNETGLLDKTHLHFYDFDEVKRVFQQAGLHIQQVDANTLNYPPSLLREKLHQLGLGDNGFIEKTQSDLGSQAFQFVGFAGSSTNTQPGTKIELSTTTPEHELTAYIEELRQVHDKYLRLRGEQQEWLRREQELRSQLAATQANLDRITSSRAWKIAKKITGPVRALKRKKESR